MRTKRAKAQVARQSAAITKLKAQDIIYLERYANKLLDDKSIELDKSTRAKTIESIVAAVVDIESKGTKLTGKLLRDNYKINDRYFPLAKEIQQVIQSGGVTPLHIEGDIPTTDVLTPPIQSTSSINITVHNPGTTDSFFSCTVEEPSSLSDLQLLQVQLNLPTGDYSLAFDTIQTSLAACATIALRELGVLNHATRQDAQVNMGVHFIDFCTLVSIGTGKVNFNKPCRRWFHDFDLSTQAKLFEVVKKYSAGNFSTQFKTTVLAEQVMVRCLEIFKSASFKDHIPAVITDTVLYDIQLVDKTKPRDLIVLFNRAIGLIDGKLVIALNPKDDKVTRVYTTFNGISSDTRKLMGWINYDMDAALQTITLQMLPKAERIQYPLHQDLIDDKYAFRNTVATESKQTYEWAKTKLSKLDNEKKCDSNSEILQEYFKESLQLRSKLINYIKSTDIDIYNSAVSQAKDEYKKVWDKATKTFTFIPTGEKKESSIFFFIWTQVERQIREAMKTCFTNPVEVLDCHDAVYSKEVISNTVIEQAILDQTDFIVKVSQ